MASTAPETPPAGPSALARRIGPDAVLLILLLAFTLLVRLATTPMLEDGGDAILKWHYAKVLRFGLTQELWAWNWHSARLGVVLPTVLVQLVFGTRPAVYYVPAFLMSLLQVALLFRIALRLGGRNLAFGVTVALVLFPQMMRSGAQLMPAVFSGAYVLAAVALLLGHGRQGSAGSARLCLAAAALYLAYLTKLPNLLFVPGFLLGLWVASHRLRDLLIFAGTLAGLILLETTLYALFTEHTLGRFSIVFGAGSALPASSWWARTGVRPIGSFLHLFDRYTQLTGLWKPTFFAYCAATAGLLASKRLRSDGRIVLITAAPASFFLGTTFAIRSLHPIEPIQPFLSRYLTAALPLVLLVIGVAVRELLGRRPFANLRPLPVGWLAAVLAILAGVVTWRYFPGFDEHPMARLEAYRRMANPAFEAGAPVVSGDLDMAVMAYLSVIWDGDPELRPGAAGEGAGERAAAASFPRIQAVRLEGGRRLWYAERRAAADKPPPEGAELLKSWQGRELIWVRAIHIPHTDGFTFGLERVTLNASAP